MSSSIVFGILIIDSQKEATINLRLTRQSTPQVCNEYVPCGTLISEINSYSYKNILILHKLKPTEPWTEDLSLNVHFAVQLSQYRVMQPSHVQGNYNVHHVAYPSFTDRPGEYEMVSNQQCNNK